MLDPNVFLQNPAPDFKMNQLCKVCGEPAAGFHFGAFTCEGCKSFFGRTYNNVSGIAECKNGGRCEINKKNRTSCKSCRLRKCLRVGMSKSGSRYGRRSNWFKIHCLLQAQQQQQNGSSGGSELSSTSSIIKTSTITKEQVGGGGSSSNNNNNNNNSSDHGFLRRHHHHHHHDEGSRHHHHHSVKSEPSSEASKFGSRSIKEEQRSLESPRSESSATSCSSPPGAPGPPLTPSMIPPPIPSLLRQSSGHPQHPHMLPQPPTAADLLSFDLITRDLMKMGYDPLRLWPMLSTMNNPYLPKFMFPPNLFNPMIQQQQQQTTAKMLELHHHPSPPPQQPHPLANLPLLPVSMAGGQTPLLNGLSSSKMFPTNLLDSNTILRNRIVPSAATTTTTTTALITPPISLESEKLSSAPLQDKPIDLSAKTKLDEEEEDEDEELDRQSSICSEDDDDNNKMICEDEKEDDEEDEEELDLRNNNNDEKNVLDLSSSNNSSSPPAGVVGVTGGGL